MKEQITTWRCTCERCGHIWNSKGEDAPITCPGCKSVRWDRVIEEGKPLVEVFKDEPAENLLLREREIESVTPIEPEVDKNVDWGS